MSLPLPTIKSGGKERLDALLSEVSAKHNVPAVFYLATNADGTIYENQQGDVNYGDESSGKVNGDTTMELFSMTKLVTSLVEQGLVGLDSTEDIEKHLPEISGLQIISGYNADGTPTLSKPTTKVTLRMLMTHTAGFVYANANPLITEWVAAHAIPGNFDPKATIADLALPFIYEPGTSWTYSTALDWVGKLVERVSGLRLDEYFQRNVFDRVEGGMRDVSFFPTPSIKERKMGMCTRDGAGNVKLLGTYGSARPTEVETVNTNLLLGGAGLYGTLKDYLAFLRAVLRCDPRYSSPSKPLLSPESYAQLFKGCVPTAAGRERMTHQMAQAGWIVPPATPETINHSIAMMVTSVDVTDGRKKGSGFWSGAAKTQYWIDPTTGLAAIVGTQLLSPAPDPWFQAYREYEVCLYKNLA